MKNFIIGLNALDVHNKLQIRDEFFKDFGIDLDSNKFATGDLLQNWKQLIEECTVGKNRESLSEYIRLFKDHLLKAIDFDRLNTDRDFPQIIKATQVEKELQENREEEFENIVKDYCTLLDNYYLYEVDVWLNAWLAIQYIKSNEKRMKVAENENTKTMVSRKPKTGFVDTATSFVKGKNEMEYSLPFVEDADGYFCGKYLKYVLRNTGALFWTEQDKKEIISNRETQMDDISQYWKQVNILMKRDSDYSRFSYQRIKEIENQKDFELEDKILFHKTIDGVWVRNMLNTMIDSQGYFEAEDYIYLIDGLCGCKSLLWQNLISCLFIIVKEYQSEIYTLNLDEVILPMFYCWLSNIGRINYTLCRLTEALLYLYQRLDCPDEVVKKRCTSCLQQLEMEKSEGAEKYWEGATDKLRVTEYINRNHKSFEWIYAIFQREIIHKIKYCYRNNGFLERPLRENIYINYMGSEVALKNIRLKYSCFQPDVERAKKELKEKIISNKENRFE